jgi:hypothetical protein
MKVLPHPFMTVLSLFTRSFRMECFHNASHLFVRLKEPVAAKQGHDATDIHPCGLHFNQFFHFIPKTRTATRGAVFIPASKSVAGILAHRGS